MEQGGWRCYTTHRQALEIIQLALTKSITSTYINREELLSSKETQKLTRGPTNLLGGEDSVPLLAKNRAKEVSAD